MKGPGPEQVRQYWDSHAERYDRQMGFFDRRLFGDTRQWVCSRAAGRVLEVGIGTGLNLPHYPAEVELTGLEFSTAMLDHARRRAGELDRPVELREGDAHVLPFPDACFDTVVCTFTLCSVADDRQVTAEMARVLRPGGQLLLADHVASSAWLVRGLQRLMEVVTVPMADEHFTRRPIRHVENLGLHVHAHDRFKLGIVERLAATRPAD